MKFWKYVKDNIEDSLNDTLSSSDEEQNDKTSSRQDAESSDEEEVIDDTKETQNSNLNDNENDSTKKSEEIIDFENEMSRPSKSDSESEAKDQDSSEEMIRKDEVDSPKLDSQEHSDEQDENSQLEPGMSDNTSSEDTDSLQTSSSDKEKESKIEQQTQEQDDTLKEQENSMSNEQMVDQSQDSSKSADTSSLNQESLQSQISNESTQPRESLLQRKSMLSNPSSNIPPNTSQIEQSSLPSNIESDIFEYPSSPSSELKDNIKDISSIKSPSEQETTPKLEPSTNQEPSSNQDSSSPYEEITTSDISSSLDNGSIPQSYKDTKSELDESMSDGEDEEELETESEKTIAEKKELLQKLRDKLQELADKRKEEQSISSKKDKAIARCETEEYEKSEEEKYELSEQTNQFIDELMQLPSFQDRERGPGYAIDTNGFSDVPDSMIRTLITKFLNQRFCKKQSDLNVRSNSLQKSRGFYKWEVKDVITHLETHQVTKVFDDKYGYEYASGHNETVPLSFYFDMSGSMSSYTNLLSVIAIELLKKNVKVLIGFNERVNVQIESITKNITVAELASILESAGYSRWSTFGSKNSFKKDSRVTFKYIDRNIDNYLIDRKAEKCVVFSDFDPIDEIINLSQKVSVYWFCFEQNFTRSDLQKYRGFIYPVSNIKDIAAGLIKVNEKRFEALIYTDNPKILRKKIGDR